MGKTVVACFGCKKYPKLRIRHLQFENGVLDATSESDATLVRNADGFGIYVLELEVGVSHQIEPENPTEGTAKSGMRSTLNRDSVTHEESTTPPNPETDTPADVFPQPDWPQDREAVVEQPAKLTDLVVKVGGWYELDGKNYRKADLPESYQKLV